MIGVYVNSTYSLLIFLLIKEKEETIYFCEQGFYSRINEKYLFDKNNLIILGSNIKSPFKKIKKIYRNLKLLYKMKCNKINKVYVRDNLYYSDFIIDNCNCNIYVLEDGTINYNQKILEKEISDFSNIKKKFYSISFLSTRKRYPSYGLSDKISKIFLTGILPIPKLIKNKVEIVDLKKKWNELTKEKKNQILDIFKIDKKELETLSLETKKILLLTQPLSEDGLVSEEEKIKIYRDILIERKIKKIFIKKHPREYTDYKKIFKDDIEVIDISNNFPVELLPLFDVKFEKTITIFSTAAFFFKKYGDVEFIGTEPYKRIYEKVGSIKL